MMIFDDKVGGWGWLNAKNAHHQYQNLLEICIHPFEDITDQFNSSD